MITQHNNAKRWQFSLQSLFAVTTSVAVGLAIWPILLVGALTSVAVLIGIIVFAVYYWHVFAVGAITGVVVTRSIVLAARWLDAREEALVRIKRPGAKNSPE